MRASPITVFEITTAAALLLFAEEPADVLLLEVGLGGRFDATNVIDQPAAAVVTSIGLDHAEYLGTTLEGDRPREGGHLQARLPGGDRAAGLSRRPTRSCARRPSASAPRPILVGAQDFSVHEESGRLVYQDEDGLLDLPLPRLVGRHQFINAGTAIAALRAAGFGDSRQPPSRTGLRRRRLAGPAAATDPGTTAGDRARASANSGSTAATTSDGGRVLAAAMADLGERSDAPLVLIVGHARHQGCGRLLPQLRGLAREVIAVPIAGQIAARPADEVAAIAGEVGLVTSVQPSVEAALASLHDSIWERPPRVLICGSLYLAGEVLAANGTLPQ